MMAPEFEKMAKRYNDGAIFIKVDCDKFKSLAQKEGVSGYPTFHFYKNQVKIAQMSGANAPKLESLIKKHMTPSHNSSHGHNSNYNKPQKSNYHHSNKGNNNYHNNNNQQYQNKTHSSHSTASNYTSASSSSYEWGWKTDKGKCIPYSQDINKEIEALQIGESYFVFANNTQYEVRKQSKHKCIQTNISTNKSRDVIRQSTSSSVNNQSQCIGDECKQNNNNLYVHILF